MHYTLKPAHCFDHLGPTEVILPSAESWYTFARNLTAGTNSLIDVTNASMAQQQHPDKRSYNHQTAVT